ncbi:MAG: menaquinone biosynthesis protein [Bacteroidia bacterium]|nr:menaquinone biosynthesis protein [Bacteroidia bacterium]
MIKIALVSYINTRPFIDGLERFFDEHEVQLHILPPSACARALKEGRVDMALMPVGALVNFQHISLLSNFCIGGNGPVNSVFIFSEVPISSIDFLYLDPHSRSSNGLARVLLKHHWKKDVPFQMLPERPFDVIKGRHAGVIIGDQAIKCRGNYAYEYDLSEHWKKMTSLSFPFAVWGYDAAKLNPVFLSKIEEALEWGVAQRRESAIKWAAHYGIPEDFAIPYLMRDIDFKFDYPKHKALHLYQHALTSLPQLQLQTV